MKAVILAGGLGTRLAEETEVRPKPMVDVGGRPILWHIMKHFAHQGFHEFVVALGYKGEVIKRYFRDYAQLTGSMRVDLRSGRVEQACEPEDWVVDLVETGQTANTGTRVRRLRSRLGDEPFIVTYGDGVSNVDLGELVRFHKAQGRLGTVTAVRPPARYGGIFFEGPLVAQFTEKPQAGEGWINGGYIVLEPAALEYLPDADDVSLEAVLLERLAKERQLAAYRHHGFWQCMDTLRDKRFLESLWSDGQAPWKVW